MRTSDFLNHHIDIEQRQHGRDDAPDDPPAVKAPKALRNFAAARKVIRHAQLPVRDRDQYEDPDQSRNSKQRQAVLQLGRASDVEASEPHHAEAADQDQHHPAERQNDVCGDDKPLAERDDFRPARRRTFSRRWR